MDLTGSILISMPGMGDPRFAHSVVLICAHSDEGAMGLIVNKPLPDLNFAGLLQHLNIPTSPEGRDIRVHFGGPVERTIEYVAPFDKCDREQDYETAWAFFSKQL